MLKRTTLWADAALFLVAAIWGGAFVAQRLGAETTGALTFNGLRFAIGGAVLWPLVRLRRSERMPPSSAGGILLGMLLFGGATAQQIGMAATTAGKAGFITGLYVILVPVLLVLFWRESSAPLVWAGAAMAVGGLFLLSVGPAWRVETGDGWELLGTLFWAAHVIAVGKLVQNRDPLHLAMVQFLTCALLSLAAALLVEEPSLADLARAPEAVAYAGFLSTAGAYTLQTIAQRYADPARAGLILSSESLFAALFGFLFLGEHLTRRQMLGAALILGGIIAAQAGKPARK